MGSRLQAILPEGGKAGGMQHVSRMEGIEEMGTWNNQTCREQTEQARAPTRVGAPHAEAHLHNRQHRANMPKHQAPQSREVPGGWHCRHSVKVRQAMEVP